MTAVQPIRQSLAPYEPYPIYDMLRHSAARQPEKVAIIDGDRRLTYHHFDAYTDHSPLRWLP